MNINISEQSTPALKAVKSPSSHCCFHVIMTKSKTATVIVATHTLKMAIENTGRRVPHSRIYKKLKPYRSGIERTFALVKENRYRMEISNRYKGIENVTIHAIEHDIALNPGYHL